MELRYPPTKRIPVTQEMHGQQVADPYRWLEDTDSEQTRAWIAAQNELTNSWLRQGTRSEIRDRLAELWDFQKLGSPVERGGRWFQWRQDGLANQPVLYVAGSPDDPGKVLLDPNLMAADGTVAVTGVAISRDGRLVAYGASEGGSDWTTWRVRSAEDGEDLPDVVTWSKFSLASWRADGSGFYYGAPERPADGRELTGETVRQRILWHRLGTDPGGDPIVFECPGEPELIPEAAVSEDGRWLVVSVYHGTRPENRLYLRPPDGEEWLPVVTDFVSANSFVTSLPGAVILLTDRNAELGRLVRVDPEHPDPGDWLELVGEEDDRLLEVHHFGDALVCHYLRHASSRLVVRAMDGTLRREIELPPAVTVTELSGHAGFPLMHFRISGFTDSGSIWSHDLTGGETRQVSRPAAAVDPDDYVTEQVFAPSPDGTRIPMFITRRRDLDPSRPHRTLLYGYGGFNVPLTPEFKVDRALWLERGGVLAVANLRGGGEYGRKWHDSGRLTHKQNVFDDFCACARWLCESGWTTPSRLAINGASNGGLLVGACLTQHPELFGAAIPEVGVLDMLRFHRFTIGWAWTSDFGNPDVPAEFEWVRAYSPLHNVKRGTCYPPTLILTGDHDDRVVPGHSFKFAAAMQEAQGCDRPVLIRVETSAGHGLGKPTSKIIAERSDVLAFCEQVLEGAAPQSVGPVPPQTA